MKMAMRSFLTKDARKLLELLADPDSDEREIRKHWDLVKGNTKIYYYVRYDEYHNKLFEKACAARSKAAIKNLEDLLRRESLYRRTKNR